MKKKKKKKKKKPEKRKKKVKRGGKVIGFKKQTNKGKNATAVVLVVSKNFCFNFVRNTLEKMRILGWVSGISKECIEILHNVTENECFSCHFSTDAFLQCFVNQVIEEAQNLHIK